MTMVAGAPLAPNKGTAKMADNPSILPISDSDPAKISCCTSTAEVGEGDGMRMRTGGGLHPRRRQAKAGVNDGGCNSDANAAETIAAATTAEQPQSSSSTSPPLPPMVHPRTHFKLVRLPSGRHQWRMDNSAAIPSRRMEVMMRRRLEYLKEEAERAAAATAAAAAAASGERAKATKGSDETDNSGNENASFDSRQNQRQEERPKSTNASNGSLMTSEPAFCSDSTTLESSASLTHRGAHPNEAANTLRQNGHSKNNRRHDHPNNGIENGPHEISIEEDAIDEESPKKQSPRQQQRHGGQRIGQQQQQQPQPQQRMIPIVELLNDNKPRMYLDFGEENLVGSRTCTSFEMVAPYDNDNSSGRDDRCEYQIQLYGHFMDKGIRVCTEPLPQDAMDARSNGNTTGSEDDPIELTLKGGQTQRITVTWNPVKGGCVREVLRMKLTTSDHEHREQRRRQWQHSMIIVGEAHAAAIDDGDMDDGEEQEMVIGDSDKFIASSNMMMMSEITDSMESYYHHHRGRGVETESHEREMEGHHRHHDNAIVMEEKKFFEQGCYLTKNGSFHTLASHGGGAHLQGGAAMQRAVQMVDANYDRIQPGVMERELSGGSLEKMEKNLSWNNRSAMMDSLELSEIVEEMHETSSLLNQEEEEAQRSFHLEQLENERFLAEESRAMQKAVEEEGSIAKRRAEEEEQEAMAKRKAEEEVVTAGRNTEEEAAFMQQQHRELEAKQRKELEELFAVEGLVARSMDDTISTAANDDADDDQAQDGSTQLTVDRVPHEGNGNNNDNNSHTDASPGSPSFGSLYSEERLDDNGTSSNLQEEPEKKSVSFSKNLAEVQELLVNNSSSEKESEDGSIRQQLILNYPSMDGDENEDLMLAKMIEEASHEANRLSPENKDYDSDLDYDKSELKAFIGVVKELEEVTHDQHDYITSPANKDDFITQLDHLNDQIDKIDGITSPCVERKIRTSSEKPPSDSRSSKAVKSRKKSQLDTPEKVQCYSNKLEKLPPLPSLDEQDEGKNVAKRNKKKQIHPPSKKSDVISTISAIEKLREIPENEFKTPHPQNNPSERMASLRNEVRRLSGNSPDGPNHQKDSAAADDEARKRSAESRRRLGITNERKPRNPTTAAARKCYFFKSPRKRNANKVRRLSRPADDTNASQIQQSSYQTPGATKAKEARAKRWVTYTALSLGPRELKAYEKHITRSIQKAKESPPSGGSGGSSSYGERGGRNGSSSLQVVKDTAPNQREMKAIEKHVRSMRERITKENETPLTTRKDAVKKMKTESVNKQSNERAAKKRSSSLS